jgi:hypothetical protein
MMPTTGISLARECVLVVLLASGISVPVGAATEYGFTITSKGEYPAERRGRIVVDGSRWRIDYESDDQVRVYDSVIGGGNSERIAINHANRTWYRLRARAPFGIGFSLFDFYRVYPSRVLKPQVKSAGEKTVSFQYVTQSQIGTESLGGEVSGSIVVSTRESLDDSQPLALLLDINTNFPEIDTLLKTQLASIQGTHGDIQLTITRKLKGGKPMTQVIFATVGEGHIIAFQPMKFEIPEGYHHQEPAVGAPGN